MPNTFLIADTHFSHQKMYEFTNFDGTKVRPWDTCEEGDEIMVDRWNAVVRPNDKVYHLGDVAIPRRGLDILARLNGSKVLIRGNHDIFKLRDYAQYFKDVRGSHKLDQYVLTHVPIHPGAIARWMHGNIHGHLHNNVVTWAETVDTGISSMPEDVPDPRYINVSVERINYTPIAFEALRKEHLA